MDGNGRTGENSRLLIFMQGQQEVFPSGTAFVVLCHVSLVITIGQMQAIIVLFCWEEPLAEETPSLG